MNFPRTHDAHAQFPRERVKIVEHGPGTTGSLASATFTTVSSEDKEVGEVGLVSSEAQCLYFFGLAQLSANLACAKAKTIAERLVR